MISRSGDPYRGFKRTFRVALIVSLLIHPLIIALFAINFAVTSPQNALRSKRDPAEIVTISSATTHAKRALAQPEPRPQPARPKSVTRPQRIAKRAAVPVEKPVVVPTYAPAPPVKRDLAKVAPGTPVPVRARPAPVAAPLPKTVAKAEVPAVPHAQTQGKPGQYSAAQLAQIESDLSKSIEQTRGSNNPLSNVNKPIAAAAAPKHYSINYKALNGGLDSGEGICDPIKDFTDGGWDYYYMACNLVEGDGSTSRQALPWPIRYRPREDPYKNYLGQASGPIPLPPPGWRPDPGRPMDPIYLGYLRAKGFPI